MPQFLRHVRKSKWYRHAGVPWLLPNELQADALGDVSTQDNTLSVWYVDDAATNLDQVLTAIASTRSVPSNLDYVLLDESIITQLGIEVVDDPAATPFPSANNWHRNLVHLTRRKLLDLVAFIAQSPRPRRQSDDLKELLRQARDAGLLDQARVQPTLLAHL